MNAFEIFLLNPKPEPVSAEQIRAGLRAVPWTRQHNDGPRPSFSYLNADTGVYFAISAPALDAHVTEVDEGEDAEMETEGAAEADAEPALELAAMTLSVPLLCPRFFGAEAASAALRMAAAAGLEATAGDGLSAAEEIASAWAAANQAATESPGCQGVSAWAPEDSTAWYSYGAGRAALEAELGPQGIAVPRLQAAKQAGRVRSLYTWDEGTPSVLPQAGLVLVRRERRRRGLLFQRQVREEGIAEASLLWDIVAGAAERRETPSPLLVYRNAVSPPQDVAARLEVLALQPVESAKRTHLIGVVDSHPVNCKEPGP